MHLNTYFLITVVGGEDYTSGGYNVTFLNGSTTAELTIDINATDNILELTEIFTARLSVSQSVSDLGVSVGSDDTATVNIEDDDGECVDMAQAFFSSFKYHKELIVQTSYRLCIIYQCIQDNLSNPYTILYSIYVSAYMCLFFAVVTVEFRPFEYTVTESHGDVELILVADKEASFDYIVEVTTADSTASGEFIVKYV